MQPVVRSTTKSTTKHDSTNEVNNREATSSSAPPTPAQRPDDLRRSGPHQCKPGCTRSTSAQRARCQRGKLTRSRSNRQTSRRTRTAARSTTRSTTTTTKPPESAEPQLVQQPTQAAAGSNAGRLFSASGLRQSALCRSSISEVSLGSCRRWLRPLTCLSRPEESSGVIHEIIPKCAHVASGAADFCCAATSFAGVFISVGFAPPCCPCMTSRLPEEGLMWMPGYWPMGRRLLLCTRHLVPAPMKARCGPRLLGWSEGIYVFHPATGSPRRLLWRRQLRLRIHGRGFCRRHVAWPRLCL